MARGSRSLAHLDFSQPTLFSEGGNSGEPGELRKGRNKDLYERHCRKIIARYYYHNAILMLPYHNALAIITEEFDIDQRTVAMIIKKNETLITEMRKKKPSVDSFKKEFHYFKF